MSDATKYHAMHDGKGVGAFMVNRFSDAGEICELRLHTVTHLDSFYLGLKRTPNKQRAAKPYKMAIIWVHVTQKSINMANFT